MFNMVTVHMHDLPISRRHTGAQAEYNIEDPIPASFHKHRMMHVIMQNIVISTNKNPDAPHIKNEFRELNCSNIAAAKRINGPSPASITCGRSSLYISVMLHAPRAYQFSLDFLSYRYNLSGKTELCLGHFQNDAINAPHFKFRQPSV